MRLDRLELLRFGHFTDVSLEFPDAACDMHIVFGPNEAGKSTSLAAIEDLLFGIPHNSDHGFIHGYAGMRIGGLLQHGEQRLQIRRRKGNKDTLLGADELPLAGGESVLASLIGGADRDFFIRMFCLDHERLASGGRDILDARDDVGQTLFSAGSGVAGLHEQIEALKKESDALWGPRRAGHRQFYRLLDALNDADKALREHTVTASRWHETRRALDEAQAEFDALEAQRETHAAEQRKLSRIRRVYRQVDELRRVKAERTGLAEVRLLPEDAAQRLSEALQVEASARAKLETLNAQRLQAQCKRAGLVCDRAMLMRAEDIRLLHERRIQVRKAKADLPGQKAELEAAIVRLRGLADELGWPAGSVEQLCAGLPRRAELSASRALLTGRGERRSQLDTAARALQEGAAERAARARELETLADAHDVSTLASLIEAAREHADVGSRMRSAQRVIDETQAQIDTVLARLRPSFDDERGLLVAAVPPRAVVQTHRDRAQALNEDLRECRQREQDLRQTLTQQREAHDRIVFDRNIVPRETLQAARERRDAGWSLVRQRHIQGETLSEAALSDFAGDASDLVDAYERAVVQTDALADRRFDQAQAVGELAAMAAQIEAQRSALDAARAQRQAFEAQQVELQDRWAEIWRELPFEPLAPDYMLVWLDERDRLLGLIARRDEARAELIADARVESQTRASILDELSTLGTTVDTLRERPLRMVLEHAAAVRRAQEKRASERDTLCNALAQLDADLARRRQAVDQAEAAWREWQQDWSAALTTLGLDPATAAAQIADQLDTIEQMRDVSREIERLRHEHIGRIEQELQDFGAAVRSLAETLGGERPDSAPEDIMVALETRLAEAQRVHELQVETDRLSAELDEQIDALEADARDARLALRELYEISGTSDPESLHVAIERSQGKRRLDARHEELLRDLEGEGDGLPVQTLLDECEGVDLDQVAAREQTLLDELDDLDGRRHAATEARAEKRQALEAIGGDGVAAQAAAERQEALAGLRDCAEQFVRVQGAVTLLRWAIDRYRREKQAPLLSRAGAVFATLTAGAFDGLRVGYDEQDRAHLEGTRPSGAGLEVKAMSEGTADQLYLALRLASVEEYLQRAHPLPFIADDLFVNFDDDRAAAGFEVLAELGRQTQVLFFTHHQHLVDIARSRLGESINVIRLDRRPLNQEAPNPSAAAPGPVRGTKRTGSTRLVDE
ncbi:MAG: AAA family ATPase [Gammaproteobacteria bacterium]|nr:AAA family ATPase [Gammaproteobacteria bacterium]